MEHIIIVPASHLPQGPDHLYFLGHFVLLSMALTPRPMPDGTSVVNTLGSGISSGSPGLVVGHPYTIKGAITGSNFLRVPHLTFVAGEARRSSTAEMD
ncbi:hypothetical protein MJO28_008760 [Puccinia striiformis f. sp. tritici]|uniref:Uncharacterized protein n=1 Tax=Puccinia striiformis f. sp. tritici TaxID=168172 RepID=A0ACC0EC29_9BASI|nr:hypothetical protein MJO28_008760 [Puccinia striiformis f. sp. tritici]KAI7953007.1 hypothetical protein MJO29_008638 [Puccinia striiformis f. sp. tritici]